MKKSFLAWIFALAMLLPACQAPADPSVSAPNSQSGSGSGPTDIIAPGGGSVNVGDKPACVHKDADNNEICDVCKESVIVTVDFLALNDLHGKFNDEEGSIGVDEMSTYFAQAKAKNPNTVLIASGDMWQGGGVSNITDGKIVTEWMNEMGFVSMSMGNHEYDWTRTKIEENAELANFPFLALNLYDEETNKRVEYCDASVMVEVGGVQIGVIGAIGDCESSIATDKREGLLFKTGAALTSLVKAEATALRANGADYIVYSLHGAYNDAGSPNEYSTTLSKGYVDLVFEAHTHQMYCEQDQYGVYHVQGGGYGSGLSQATVRINSVTGKPVGTTAKNISKSAYQSLDDHPIVARLMEKYADQIASVQEIIGYNDTARDRVALGQAVAQMYYKAGVEKWGTKYNGKTLIGGGGNLNIRAPGLLPKGTVKFGSLIDLLPFDNSLVLCEVKGSVLKSRFYDQTTATYPYYFYDAGFGKANIQDNETYCIVTDKWNSPYDANQLKEIELYDDVTYARHLLAEHIKKGGFGTMPEQTQGEFTSYSEIYATGNALEDNQVTTQTYRVCGQITEITTNYGTMTICWGEETLSVYSPNEYSTMTDKPEAGDFIILEGIIKKYKPSSGDAVVQMFKPNIISFQPLTTVKQAKEIGGELDAGESTADTYYILCEVKNVYNVTRGSMYVKDIGDTSDVEIHIYQLKDESGNAYGTLSNPPAAGDFIVVQAKLKHYQYSNGNTVIELSDATIYAM